MPDAKRDVERLGSYRLDATLGSGAMGTVYRGWDEEHDRAVALKVVHPHLLDRRGFFRRFQREAEAGARVDHENVVRTFDADLEMLGGTLRCFLVLEYVEGRTLRDLLADLGRVPEALLLEIARQVTEGLAAIHAAGIVHRDIKPENVMITHDHRVRIMDLGVARLLEAATLTREGQFAGSLLYAAPEQLRGERVGPAADLYALGVLLHELASGENPFRRADAEGVMRGHLEECVSPLTEIDPDLSPFLAEVVATLLAKEPSARFASAAELRRVLEQAESSAWWDTRRELRERARSSIPRVPVRRETRVCGREADLALLKDLWAKARARHGNTLLVEGEAGIGKSRLVDTLLAGLGTDGPRVLYGSFPPGGGDAIADGLLAAFPGRDLAEQLRLYLGTSPSLAEGLAAWLRHAPPPAGVPSLAGDLLHAALVQLVRGLASERPLLWVVEDLHFASAEERGILLSLARAVEGHPLFLLLTTRPAPVSAEQKAAFDRIGTFRRTVLERLEARDVLTLVDEAFRSDPLSERLGAKIALHSDGVPFFVFEMIRALQEGQFVTQARDGSWVESKGIDALQVPSAVRDLVAVRLGGLTREERAVLDVGAVWGFEFDADLVAAALGRPLLPVLQDLAHVEHSTGIVRAAGRRHRFDHHQIQEVLYADLSVPLVEAHHAAIADALEARAQAAGRDPEGADGALCVDLSEHFLKGGRGEAALRYLSGALEHLEKRYLNDAFVALAERALSAPGLLRDGLRLEILLRLGAARGPLSRLGLRERHRATCEQALTLAHAIGDRRGEAEARRGLGGLFLDQGRYEEARAHYEAWLAIAQEIGDRRGEGTATGNLGNVFWNQGLYAEARSHYETWLEIAREVGDRDGEAKATGNLGILHTRQGRYEEACGCGERRLALARQLADVDGEAAATINLGNILNSLARSDEAAQHFERGLALARQCGNRLWEANARGNLGNQLLYQGRYEEARAHFVVWLRVAREIADPMGEGLAAGFLGRVDLAQGRLESALAHLAKWHAAALELRDRWGEGTAAGYIGLVLAAQGRSAEARVQFDARLAISRQIGDRRGTAGGLVDLGLLWLVLGDMPCAREALEAALALSREIGTPHEEGCALLGLSRLADEDGDADRARDLAGRSLAVRRKIGYGDGVAEALIRLAELHLCNADSGAARAALDEAVSLAHGKPWEARVATALALLARLPGGDPNAAIAALRDAGEDADTPWIRCHLWKATGDREHLEEARRLLGHLVEHAPEACREPMLRNVRLHREIVQAWASAEPADAAGAEAGPRSGP